eukprot:scpid47782/ scgid12647/ 
MHVNVPMYGCVTGQVGGRALRRRARTPCPLPQVSVFVMICVAVCWPTSAISSALPAATVTDAMQNGTLEYGGSGLYNDTVTGNLSMSYPDNTTSDDITTDTTTSTITTGVGTGDDEGSLAKRIIKEPLFIGLCVGVGALIPITAITLVIANRQHKIKRSVIHPLQTVSSVYSIQPMRKLAWENLTRPNLAAEEMLGVMNAPVSADLPAAREVPREANVPVRFKHQQSSIVRL